MARKCSICTHEDRKKIDNDLIEKKKSIDAISNEYHVTTSSLNRHVANGHIEKKIVKAVEKKELKEAETVIDRIKALSIKAESILSQAEDSGDFKTACSAIREARATMELLLKVSGELKGNETTVNVAVVTHEFVLIDTPSTQMREPKVIDATPTDH